VTAARMFVRGRLGDQSTEAVEAAELMASELASNCVLHARTDFQLAIHLRDQIRIEVSDSADGRPTLLSPTPRELTGRGLLIVDALSDAWGVIPTASGTTVWFTLPRASDEEFPSAARDRPSRSTGSRK
jgi:hypothetical protein